jgi:hypothetical protein
MREATRRPRPTVTGHLRPRDRAPVASAGSEQAADSSRRRRPIAFALHQLFEYLLAVALVVASVHIGHSALLLAAGALFGLLALTAQGPLGLLRVCGRRLHLILDVSAAVLLAAAPLEPALRPGVAGIVVIELVAVAWVRVTTLTRYGDRADGGDGRASVDTAAAASSGPTPAPAEAGPALGVIRGLGRMTAGARRRLPDAGVTLDSRARRMGGQAGRLLRAWRRPTR